MHRELCIGDWTLHTQLNRLVGPEREARLEPRAAAVLMELARAPGEVRTRGELLAAVWGEAFVGEAVLTHAIWELRRALGDRARDPRYIQTIPRRGYRLVAPVAAVTVETRRTPPGPARRVADSAPGRPEDRRKRRAVRRRELEEAAADRRRVLARSLRRRTVSRAVAAATLLTLALVSAFAFLIHQARQEADAARREAAAAWRAAAAVRQEAAWRHEQAEELVGFLLAELRAPERDLATSAAAFRDSLELCHPDVRPEGRRPAAGSRLGAGP